MTIMFNRDNRTVGGRYRYARVELGMSLVELADAVGLTHVEMSKIERNVRMPDDETIEALESVLGVKPLYARRKETLVPMEHKPLSRPPRWELLPEVTDFVDGLDEGGES